MKTRRRKTMEQNKFTWCVPKELGIPADSLRLRVDFFHQSTTLTSFDGDTVTTRQVDAMDISHALSRELAVGTGLLPENTLWWLNSRDGQVYAIYVEPKVRKVTLQDDLDKPPQRFEIPLPGFVFLCSPCKAPWVVAVTKRPTKATDIIYHAPLLNIFRNGRSCPGSNKYPERVQDIVESFFTSFFSSTADLQGRSKKYPKNITQLWKFLDGKEEFPIDDLEPFGTLGDLMKFGTEEDE
jgi:PRTRC genetic system protein B